MNVFQIPTSIVERLGWVLVHSAWEFALIALVAMALQRAMVRCSAKARYGMLLAAFAGIAVSLAVTWLNVSACIPVAPVAVVSDQSVPGPRESSVPFVDRDPAAASASELLDADDARPAEQHGSSEGALRSGLVTDRWWASVEAGVQPWLRWIVTVWCLGVVTCGLRPLLSWYTLRRLRSVGVSPVPAAVGAMLEQSAERLRLRQAVQILQSTLTRVPVVIGYLRPVILLPASVLTGVPTSQLEAIVTHELAHVRRHDFLVNLLQTLVETVFFYHPAVWWLSHRIRVERENCCDDLAVAALGNRVEYGRALLAIEELRGTATTLALGVRSGSLLNRVRRLFDREPAERALSAGGSFGFSLLALVIIAVGVWASTQADDEGLTPGATVALEDGIQIKLLGVSYQPSENKPWWKPEGGALPGDPLANRWKYSESRVYDEGEHRELALEITGAELDVHALVDFAPGDKLGLWSTFWNFQDDAQSPKKVTLIRAVSAGFPKKEKQKDVLVRLAMAPWHPYQVIDLKREKPQPEKVREDGKALFRGVRELTDGTTQVDLLFPDKFELRAHHEVIGEDLDGKSVDVHGITVGDAGARGLVFRCPQERLAKVRLRFRWYTHAVTFRDVSLDPKHMTQVKAKVTNLEPPPMPNAAMLPNGATVELLGVTYHNWKRNDWWRADGSRLAGAPLDPNLRQVTFTTIDVAARQAECREFAVRISGLPNREQPFGYQFGYEPYVDAAHRAVIYEPTEFRTAELAPISTHHVKTVTLRIGMNELPEHVLRSISVDGKKLGEDPAEPALRQADEFVQPVRVEDVNGQTRLLLKEVRRGTGPIIHEMVPIAIDRDGQQHRSIQSGGQPGFFAYLYPLPRERIVRFEYSLRVFRNWVTFENVSLDPGQTTNVKVKVESLAETTDARVVDMTKDPAALLKQLKERDLAFENRSLETEQRWVEKVSPRSQIAANRFAARKFGQSDPGSPPDDEIPADFDQPHRLRRRLTVREPEVTIERLEDLESMKHPKYVALPNRGARWSSAGGIERVWSPETNTLHIQGAPSRDGILRMDQRMIEWCCGYGVAKWMQSIDSIQIDPLIGDPLIGDPLIEDPLIEDQLIVKGKLRLMDYDDSRVVMQLDRDLVMRRAVISVPAKQGGGFNEYVVETRGTLHPEKCPPVAKSGHYWRILKPVGKPDSIYDEYEFTIITASEPLTDAQYAERTRIEPTPNAEIHDLRTRADVERILEKRVSLKITDRPLIFVLDALEKAHNIPITVSLKEFQARGVSPQKLVSIDVSDESLRTVFNQVLDMAGLDFEVTQEGILVPASRKARDPAAPKPDEPKPPKETHGANESG